MAERELEIIGVQELKSGTGKTGKPWTLYKVHAKKTDGGEVPEMTAFFCPPTGIGRFEVEEDGEYKGEPQYKLSQLRGSKSQAAPARSQGAVPSSELADRVASLAELVESHQRMISELVSRMDKRDEA